MRMIWAVEDVSSGMTDASFRLPPYARPLKALVFKDYLRIAQATAYEFYIVKDAADWATPGTFDYTADAVLAATITTGNPEAGFYEEPLQVATAIGARFQSGLGDWTEGRIYIRKSGGADFHTGWVGIEFN
jgi:hypothetical protein